MKTIRLFVLAALLLPALVSHAQTKEETIAWLKDKLEKYSKPSRSDLTEMKISITECEITYSFDNDHERLLIIVLPTSGMTFYEGENGTEFHYKSGVVSVKNFRYVNELFYRYSSTFIYIENSEENIYERIQKAIAHLATFCPKKQEAF